MGMKLRKKKADPQGPEPFVIVAMIVKNERANLPKLFDSAEGLVDAWAIVDTGSSDGTVEWLRAERDRTRRRWVGMVWQEDPWRDDFAHSRNLSLDLADTMALDHCPEGREPWVIMLDGDDRVRNPRAWREILRDSGAVIVSANIYSPTHKGTTETVHQLRAWRAGLGLRYRFPCHSELHPIKGHTITPAPINVCINHVGYLDDEHTDANYKRTVRILRKHGEPPASDPDSLEHYHYYLSRASLMLGDWPSAEHHAMQACRLWVERGTVGQSPPEPWIILAKYHLRHPFDESVDPFGMRAFSEGLRRLVAAASGGNDNPDIWFHILQLAALGYQTSSLMVGLGANPRVQQATTTWAHEIIKALAPTPIYGKGMVTPEQLKALRQLEKRGG